MFLWPHGLQHELLPVSMAPRENPLMDMNAMRMLTFLHQGIPNSVSVTKRLHPISTACFDRIKSNKMPPVKLKKRHVKSKNNVYRHIFFNLLYQYIRLIYEF